MSTNLNEQDARQYWRDRMEDAYAMMQACRELNVRECMEPLTDLRAAAEQAGVKIEFSATPLAPGISRIFCLRAGLAAELMAAAAEMNQAGWIMRVDDGYRSVAMQKALVYKPEIFDAIYRKTVWESAGASPSVEQVLRRVTALVATCPKIGTHMSGSAVDISVLRMDDGLEVDRGAPYIEMSELTPMASPFVSPEARRNRETITAIMARHGFVAYPYEFWHYSQGDVFDAYLTGGNKTARYGAVDWDGRQVTPLPSPESPLHSLEDIQAEIHRAIERNVFD